MPHKLSHVIARVRELARPNSYDGILLAELDRLTAAIQAHHDTKHGSVNPAAVLSPPDKALYAAAGIEHRTMAAGTLDAVRRAPAPMPA